MTGGDAGAFVALGVTGGDAGAFVALFRFHDPFLSNEGYLFVLFQDILQPQPLNALSLLRL